YAGKILDWLAQRLVATGDGAAVAAAAERAGTSAGVLLVPAFQGLASPWWQPDLRAALLGMSEATGSDHVAHAGLEAVCYQIRAILEAIGGRSDTAASPLIRVDGGMTRSRYFMQMQANVLQLPLSPAAAGSATPFGAGLMAGLGAGIWKTPDDVRAMIAATGTIRPDRTASAACDAAYHAWRQAIDMLIAQYGRAGTNPG
ncbi:MAG TPA: FGGY-family carbohydrate kinase, partial [Nordella sp.]|nr:FGGY-family carbohydrate kinase [Nordella sp.]